MKKRGFGLIMAIIFVMLVSSLGILGLNLATSKTTTTVNRYLHTQAEIYAKNFTEYVILRALKHDYTLGCLDDLNATNEIFGFGAILTHVGNIGSCKGKIQLSNPKDGGILIIDVFVWALDNNQDDEPIQHNVKFHKRTLQKL